MKLKLEKVSGGWEICHFKEDSKAIYSRHREVLVVNGSSRLHFKLPRSRLDWFGFSRLFRRALRLDKCNVFPVDDAFGSFVVIRQGVVYRFSQDEGLKETLRLRNCRNVLHQSIARTPAGAIVFGEYGANPDRREVPIYQSQDQGRSWEVVHRFPAGTIKHVHGCYWDSHAEKLWILTGDFEGESKILETDTSFTDIRFHGDGSQVYRAVNVFFEPERVVWLMDSPLEPSRLVTLDRASGKITMGRKFPGPIWYIKRLTGGGYLAGTACEVGPGVRDAYAYLYLSYDLNRWNPIARWRHDRLPKRFFKFGVIGFADGQQHEGDFVMFGEALAGFDGVVLQGKIDVDVQNTIEYAGNCRKKISAMNLSEFTELLATALSVGPEARRSQERILLFLELNHGMIKKKLQGIAGNEMEVASRLLRRVFDKKIRVDNDPRFLNAMVKVNRQVKFVSTVDLDRIVEQTLGSMEAQ